MDQPVIVQVRQGRRERQADLDAFIHRQPALRLQFVFQGARDVGGVRRTGEGCSRAPRSAFHIGVVRQLHHVVEVTRLLVPADVENFHLAFVRERDRLEPLDAFELALEGLIVLERATGNNFDGAVGAQRTASEPHVTIGTDPDAAEQFVVWNVRWLRAGRVQTR
jgi:hypothetical protein